MSVESEHATSELLVLVWDLPTRLFHWSTVALVFISWLSADQGFMTVHLISGLTLLALLLFRIAWGLVGSTTARFTDFLHPPKRVVGYLISMASDNGTVYAGHNPAGGLMVSVMITALLAQVITGLFSNDGLHFNGPLALLISDDASSRLSQIHHLIFDVVLFLVWCHVVAIGFYLFVKRHNLVMPMLSGRKPRNHVPSDAKLKFAGVPLAIFLLFLTASIAAWVMVQGRTLP
jgi:cytochrome b